MCVCVCDGRVDMEVDKRITQASKALGALRQAVFVNTSIQKE